MVDVEHEVGGADDDQNRVTGRAERDKRRGPPDGGGVTGWQGMLEVLLL
jgi:hypothetical protein